MPVEKNDICRDNPDDRKRTIVHETIPGEGPIHPAHRDNRVPNEKGESSPSTSRSTSDDDLN